MQRWRSLALIALVAALAWTAPAAQTPASRAYFPAKGTWEKRDAASLGLNQAKLDEAVAFAMANQNNRTKNMAEDIPATFRNEAPYNNVIGPTEDRTGMNGVVIRHGYVAAEWGDTSKADMTFSVTKTFLSTVVGLAYDRKLIRDLNDRVAGYMPTGVDLFTSEHNAKITWEHMLHQSSDWYGELWGKPDWADRPAENGATPADWPKRPMREPGTHYKYNDVRVNVLSLATLYVMKRPLPLILKESIMDPIGASSTWHWEPYGNAYVTIDGRKMPSVPGGGHHGGGMFISSWDMARFGYLFLNHGQWNGKQLVSEKWIALAKAPSPANTAYGFMNWFLNTPNPVENGRAGRQMYPAAPPSAVAFRGNGENIIYIDWDNDLVVVTRWATNVGGFIEKVVGAVQKTSQKPEGGSQR